MNKRSWNKIFVLYNILVISQYNDSNDTYKLKHNMLSVENIQNTTHTATRTAALQQLWEDLSQLDPTMPVCRGNSL